MKSNGQCSCGHTQFEMKAKPLMRGYCHCTICQQFNQSDFADISIFRAKDVVMPAEDMLEYKTYASPPIVHRGKCISCQQAAIEYVSLPLVPKLVVVPTANIKDSALLPEPSVHIFYDSRVKDVQDTLPKHSGYFPSQLAFGTCLIKGMFRKSA